MNSCRIAAVLAIFALTVALSARAAEPDQLALVRDLRSASHDVRNVAFRSLSLKDPSTLNDASRMALIDLLEKMNDVVAQVYAKGTTVDTVENPEFMVEVADAVAALEDPRAIQELARIDFVSSKVASALAAFGAPGIAAVLTVVNDLNSRGDQITTGLFTLRRMIEEGAVNPTDRIRIVAAGKAFLAVGSDRNRRGLWAAIALGVALRDPELVGLVQQIAASDSAVMARGEADSKGISATRSFAKSILERNGLAPIQGK